MARAGSRIQLDARPAHAAKATCYVLCFCHELEAAPECLFARREADSFLAAGGGTKRRKVVLCKDSLKEVTSLSGIAGLRESGKAQDVFVIDGFSAGTHFVERITCAPGEKNPVFSLSMTPGECPE